ncbi:unnamed protein product, partial [Rotaria socialis]
MSFLITFSSHIGRSRRKKDSLFSEYFYSSHRIWYGDRPLHPEILSVAKGSFKRSSRYNDGIRGNGYIVNALEAALWTFWYDDNFFEKGARDTVNLGDNTDTTAAIYGQLAGAFDSYENLSLKCVERLYAKKFINT